MGRDAPCIRTENDVASTMLGGGHERFSVGEVLLASTSAGGTIPVPLGPVSRAPAVFGSGRAL